MSFVLTAIPKSAGHPEMRVVLVITDEDRDALYRLRRRIYVDEMGVLTPDHPFVDGEHLVKRPKRKGSPDSWLGPAARIATKGILAGGPRRVRAALSDLEAALRREPVSVTIHEPPGAARRIVVRVEQDRGLAALLRHSDRLRATMAASPMEMTLDIAGVLISRRPLSRLLRDLRPYSTRIRLHADAAVLTDPRLDIWRFSYRLPSPTSGERRLPDPAK